MEINGKIKVIGQTESIGSNGFTKRLLVVTTDESYPQDIPMDFVKEKTDILDKYKVGESVKVSINLRGSEYQGKYYLNAQGWRIEKMDEAPVETHIAEPYNESDDSDSEMPF